MLTHFVFSITKKPMLSDWTDRAEIFDNLCDPVG